jgi:hypothetical protein
MKEKLEGMTIVDPEVFVIPSALEDNTPHKRHCVPNVSVVFDSVHPVCNVDVEALFSLDLESDDLPPVGTLFLLKVLVPCGKCSWFKVVIMIFWKGWRLPTPLKPKIHCFLVEETGGYSFYFLLNLQLK